MSLTVREAIPPPTDALFPSRSQRVLTLLSSAYVVALLVMSEVSPQALGASRIPGKTSVEWLIVLALWAGPLALLLRGNGVFQALRKPPLLWLSLLSLWGLAMAPFSLRLYFSTVIAICYLGVLAGVVFAVNQLGWVRFRRVVMGFGTVFLSFGLVAHATKYNQPAEGLEGVYEFDRLVGIGYSTNSVAMVAGALVIIAITELRTRRRWGRIPLLSSIALVVGVVAGYLTGTRMTVVAVGVALVFGLFPNRRKTVAIFAAMVIAGAALVPNVVLDQAAVSISRSGSAQDVDNGRVEVWNAGLTFGNERPVTGWGVATSGRVFDAAYKDQTVSWIALGEHNLVLRQYVTTGLPGVLLLLAAFGSYARYARSHRNPWRDALVVFLLVHGVTETSTGTLFPTQGTFLLVGLFAALAIDMHGKVETW